MSIDQSKVVARKNKVVRTLVSGVKAKMRAHGVTVVMEEAFIEGGFGRVVDGFEAERINFLYNYYVLCGPSEDPAGAKDAAAVTDAFAAIAEGKYTFISRGDKSGTHTKEVSLWPEALAITAEAESFADYTEWYVSANTGMGACLVMAEEMGGYILTDKATFLTFYANGGVIG